MMRCLLVVGLLAMSFEAYSSDAKAVVTFTPEQGFQLRDGVEERLGVKSVKVGRKGEVELPGSALVYSKTEIHIYRKRAGFWFAVPIQAQRTKAGFSLRSPWLDIGDEIATEGAGLLKIVDLHLNEDDESGHIH